MGTGVKLSYFLKSYCSNLIIPHLGNMFPSFSSVFQESVMIVTNFEVPYLFCLIASEGLYGERKEIKFPTSGDKKVSSCSGLECHKNFVRFCS